MKRTTVFIDEGLLARLQHFAKREGTSSAAVVREALTRYLADREVGRGGLPELAGRFESGHADTSARSDDLLWTDPHE